MCNTASITTLLLSVSMIAITLATAPPVLAAGNTGGKVHNGSYIGTVGGSPSGALASSNGLVTINKSANLHILGGWSLGSGSVSNNTVIFNSGTVTGGVTGGESENGNANENIVIMNGGQSTGVTGGYVEHSPTGTVIENTVTITAGTVLGGVAGGAANSGLSKNNKVNISGITTSVAANVYGGITNGDATGNNVTYSEATTGGTVYGGYSGGSGDVHGNIVTITSGTVGGLTSGHSESGAVTNSHLSIDSADITITGDVKTGSTNTGSVTGSTVYFDKADLGGGLYGAHASGTGTVGDNIVTLAGGSVGGDVVGGYSNGGTATGNTVNILGGTIDGGLYGGHGTGTDLFTDNVLNLHTKIRSSTGGSLTGAGGFDEYNFHLGADVADGDTMLGVDSAVNMGSGRNAASVDILTISGGTSLESGDKIILIDKTTGADPNIDGQMIAVEQGISRIYNFQLSVDATDENAIIACLGGYDAATNACTTSTGPDEGGVIVDNDKANAVTGGFHAGYVSTLDATLFAATEGMGAFLNEPKGGYVPFAITGGRKTSYDNGRSLNLEGFNFITGVGATRETNNGYFHLAGFAETGHQSYDASSHNVLGKGNVDYMGGGIMARLDLYNGYYFEALWRTGMTDMSYDTKSFNSPVSYDFSSLYTGGYAGFGFNKALNDRWDVGMHSKYIYTWLDDNRATLAGDLVRFKDAQSHTIRLGASAAYAYSDSLTPYGSVSFDYTVGSEIDATVNGASLQEWDIDGGTGLAQVGLRYAKPDSRWIADFNASGYTGVRDGFAANASAKMIF